MDEEEKDIKEESDEEIEVDPLKMTGRDAFFSLMGIKMMGLA